MDLFDLNKYSLRKQVKLTVDQELNKNTKFKNQIVLDKSVLSNVVDVPMFSSQWCCKKVNAVAQSIKDIDLKKGEKSPEDKDKRCLII